MKTTMTTILALYHRPRKGHQDRKSTRLNSSHGYISYAAFCLKKKHNKDKNSLRSVLCPTTRSFPQRYTVERVHPYLRPWNRATPNLVIGSGCSTPTAGTGTPV